MGFANKVKQMYYQHKAKHLPSLKYQVGLKLSPSCNCLTGNPVQVTMEVKVYKTVGNVFVASSGQFQISCNNSTGYSVTGTLQTLFQNLLVAGTNYRFEIYATNASAYFAVTKAVTVSASNIKVGGLRVKQIKNNDGISTANDIIRTYEYRDSTNTSRSSGILYEQPIGVYMMGDDSRE